jgi:hypothetical protein
MPTFNFALPAADSEIASAELRHQFNSLNDQLALRPVKPASVALLSTGSSNPPTQAQVEEPLRYNQELLTALNA